MNSAHGKMLRNVPVAQWIERWPPKPEAGVQVSPGTPFLYEILNKSLTEF